MMCVFTDVCEASDVWRALPRKAERLRYHLRTLPFFMIDAIEMTCAVQCISDYVKELNNQVPKEPELTVTTANYEYNGGAIIIATVNGTEFLRVEYKNVCRLPVLCLDAAYWLDSDRKRAERGAL